jgi:hypothetical protein
MPGINGPAGTCLHVLGSSLMIAAPVDYVQCHVSRPTVYVSLLLHCFLQEVAEALQLQGNQDCDISVLEVRCCCSFLNPVSLLSHTDVCHSQG